MVRIVEVISDGNIGGAGRLLLARLSQTDLSFFQTTVLLPKGSMLIRPLLELGVAVEEVEHLETSFDVKALTPLIRRIHHLRPQLLHAHGCLSARIAAKLCGVPVSIYTRHCAFPLTRMESNPLVQVGQGMVCKFLSDQVIAVSPAAKQNLIALGIRASQIKVIVNGSLPMRRLSDEEKALWRRRLGIPQNAFVVGICARLEPCKDHACFLRAAHILANQKNENRYFFVIVGSGTCAEALQLLCRKLSLNRCTLFTGFLEDPATVMNLFDVNVNCSIGTETASLALSEGMSLGLPAVASDFGGNPYMIRNGQNGFLYPMGNAKALAKRIAAIAEDPVLYQQLSARARIRFQKEFHAKAMAKQYEALYLSLLRKASNAQNPSGKVKI